MLNQILNTIYDIAKYQLSAYYIGTIDKNASILVKELSIVGLETAALNFPVWVQPSCSLIAALAGIIYVTKKVFHWIKSKLKN